MIKKMREKAAAPDAMLLQAYHVGSTPRGAYWRNIVESYDDGEGRCYEMAMSEIDDHVQVVGEE